MRAVGVLGALILCGLLALTSLAVAAGNDFVKHLLQGFRQGCVAESNHDLADNLDKDVFRGACTFVVDGLSRLPLADLVNRTFNEADLEDLADALAALANESLPASPPDNPFSECEACIVLVADFEAALQANNSHQTIERAFAGSCETRFKRPVDVDRCRRIVDNLSTPNTIDELVINFPPLAICRGLSRCPLP
jgi:hypothetical protein